MIIDPDVQTMAQHFGLDPRLVQAVVTAEGNIVRAVQCSVPSVQTRAAALDVVCRSAVHAMSDYVKAQHAGAFVAFWAQRWAPVGASNDPTRLNENWSPNVLKLWIGGAGLTQSTQETKRG